MLVTGDGRLRGAAGQAHAQCLDRGGHGVGRVHAATGARAGDGLGLDGLEFGVVDLVIGTGADRFEHRDDVEFLVAVAAGQDGAAIDEDGRAVQSGDANHAARHVLVAAPNGDEAVKALAADDCLDRVGNDLARHQRVLHALGAHRNAVRDGDGVEDDRLAAVSVDAFGGIIGQFVDVHVAGRHHTPGRGDADLRFGEILVGETDGVQHGAAGGALHAVDDLG